MDKPQFTIVIPTYNRKEELKRSIASVLNQTFQNWELLIVDDGSTDQTKNLALEYSQSDSRIKFLERPVNRQKGANACRNIGIEHAQGKYVAFLDSDDCWSEYKLQNDFEYISTNQNVSAIYSGALIDRGNKRVKSIVRSRHNDEAYVDFIFSKGILAQTSSFTVKRELAFHVKFDENLQRHQDIDFFIRFGKSFGWNFLNKYNTIVRWVIGEKRNMHFPSMIKVYERYRDEISSIENHAYYLMWCWFSASRFNKTYRDYYYSELKNIRKQISFKYRIFLSCPHLIFRAWKFLQWLTSK